MRAAYYRAPGKKSFALAGRRAIDASLEPGALVRTVRKAMGRIDSHSGACRAWREGNDEKAMEPGESN